MEVREIRIPLYILIRSRVFQSTQELMGVAGQTSARVKNPLQQLLFLFCSGVMALAFFIPQQSHRLSFILSNVCVYSDCNMRSYD